MMIGRKRHSWTSAFLPLLSIGLVSWVGLPGGTVRWTARDLEVIRATVEAHYPYWRLKGLQLENRSPASHRSDFDSVQSGRGGPSSKARYREDAIRFLKSLRDGHVYLEVGGRRLYPFIPDRRRDRGAFDPGRLPEHLGSALIRVGEGDVFYTRMDGNLGYILLRSFANPGIGKDVGEALGRLRRTRGLILDVRNNGGGSAAAGNAVVEWFLPESMEKPPVFHRGEQLRFFPLSPEPTAYDSPVVVLINGVCFSEAERFAEIMRQLPQVTLVGDTTGGGSAGGGDRFFLPNGAVLSFGTYDYRRYDGTPWEGEGIPPDVLVPQTSAHSAARVDVQLEKARTLLLSFP